MIYRTLLYFQLDLPVPNCPIGQAQDVGWSVLDVALSPDGGHLVYSSWSDSLHQVGATMCQAQETGCP